MKLLLTGLAALTAAPLASTAPQEVPIPAFGTGRSVAYDMRGGVWSGGIGHAAGGDLDWEPITARLVLDGATFTGTMYSEHGTESLEGALGNDVRFWLRRDRKKLQFSGELRNNVVLGECKIGSKTLPFVMVHEDALTAQEAADYTGIYAVDDRHRIAVMKVKHHMVLQDFGKGSRRMLYAKGSDSFFTGSGFAIPHPPDWIVTLLRDREKNVTSLVIEKPSGAVFQALVCCKYEQEEFEFSAYETRLSGTLTIPVARDPVPAVVYVHDSGRQTRDAAGFWPLFFAQRGTAFLAVDVRGTGKSGGTYELEDGTPGDAKHMSRRSLDVLAAVASLKEREGIDVSRVGLLGVGEAGWVMPTAAKTGAVAFTITLSGGATPLSLSARFSEIAEGSVSSSSSPSIEYALEKTRRFKWKDHDFHQDFAAQDCPGLWLYGGKDRRNPSRLCIEILEEVKEAADKDFTVVMFPDGNHALEVSRFGGEAEMPLLGDSVPGLHATIASWLDDHGCGPK